MREFGAKNVHLACDYGQVNMEATNRQVMGSSTYTNEVMRKVCMLLKIKKTCRERNCLLLMETTPSYI